MKSSYQSIGPGPPYWSFHNLQRVRPCVVDNRCEELVLEAVQTERPWRRSCLQRKRSCGNPLRYCTQVTFLYARRETAHPPSVERDGPYLFSREKVTYDPGPSQEMFDLTARVMLLYRRREVHVGTAEPVQPLPAGSIGRGDKL